MCTKEHIIDISYTNSLLPLGNLKVTTYNNYISNKVKLPTYIINKYIILVLKV